MIWLAVIALGVGALIVGTLFLRVERRAWTSLAAALAFGLGGYALQASPDLRGAPVPPPSPEAAPGEAFKEARREMIASGDYSRSNHLVTADALAARGQFVNAAAMLRGALAQDPDDAEAWLALANVLVEHADGALTDPALYAYSRAAAADPDAIGPGYFRGLALMRQGQFGEGHALWTETLEAAPEHAAGRELLVERLARLEELFRRAAAAAQQEQQQAPRAQQP